MNESPASDPRSPESGEMDSWEYQLPPTNPAPPTILERVRNLFPKAAPEERTRAARSVQGGKDSRRPVDDTLSAPYQAIACLELWGHSPASGRGTGWFVGPRIVVTAAHNLYSPYFASSRGSFAWARKVEITPGRSRGVRPFGFRLAKRLLVPRAYFEGGERAIGGEHDYGAIIIGKAFGKKITNLPMIKLNDPAGLVRHPDPLTICGYPMHLLADASQEVTQPAQYSADGRVDKVSSSGALAYYQIDTSPGQSGAPLFLKVENKYQAVGIHTYGKPDSANHGTLITGKVFQQIDRWIELSKAQIAAAGDDDTVLKAMA